MKRSFAVNLNGTIRHFDEDAYELLKDYLDSIRKTFGKSGGGEIASDIEARIEEIIDESHAAETIVTIEDVRDIIGRMGKPAELADTSVEDDESTRYTGATPPPYRGTTAVPPPISDESAGRRRLYRDPRDSVLGGVLSGLAHYLNSNVMGVRIVFVLLALITEGWFALCLYIIGWILIPAAVTPGQRLEMLGKAVNVSTVGQTILDDNFNASNPLTRRNAAEAVRKLISVCFKAFLGLVGVGVFFSAVILIINAISGLLGYISPGTIINIFDNGPFVAEGGEVVSPELFFWTLFVAAIALIIPAMAAVWLALSTLFKTQSASKRTIMALLIIEGVIIAVLFALCIIGQTTATAM